MRYLLKTDRRLLKWAYQRPFKHSFLIKVLIFMGDGPFWMIVIFISALMGQLFKIESCAQLSILLIFGFIISNVSFLLCKTYVKRQRPYANVELQKDLQISIQNRDPGHGSKELESFPSGHVLWTTLCVSLICYQYGYRSAILLGWMIPAMIYLRPHLGVHYPSDVFASLAIGGINVAIILFVAPGLMGYIHGLKNHSGYIYGYWAFIIAFLMVAFKSWLKRV